MRNVQLRSGSKSSSQTSARSQHRAISKPALGALTTPGTSQSSYKESPKAEGQLQWPIANLQRCTSPGLVLYSKHVRSSVHSSKKVEALLRQLNIAVLEWPPQSPDFNIIENIWGHMKAALASKPLHGMSRDSLGRAAHAERERLKLDATLVDSLYSSLPRRMAAAIASGGDATKY
ncbi:hypothetical protein MRX96_059421 [Rhipicephalus microplus]